MATAKTENNEKELEQKHLDNIMEQIKEREKSLKKSIKSAEGEARELNSHFFDDVKLDYDAIPLQWKLPCQFTNSQQLLSEREHAWQHSAKQLDTVERLEKRPYFARVDFKENGEEKPETIYIGLGSFADKGDHFLIYDWRAPISSIYYDGKLGKVTYNSPEAKSPLI